MVRVILNTLVLLIGMQFSSERIQTINVDSKDLNSGKLFWGYSIRDAIYFRILSCNSMI